MSETIAWPQFVDTTATVEHSRLALLEHVFDPQSRRNLTWAGLREGMRCLEVGAGAGSGARMMAGVVGYEQVTATDLAVGLLGPLAALGATVLRHDVLTDQTPGAFDFIHCRFVLEHLNRRALALQRMASWLRPGGVLLVEAGASLPMLSARTETGRAMAAANAVFTRRLGTDPGWARTLPLPLEDVGLVDCAVQATAPMVRGGQPLARWLRDTYRLADEGVIADGVLSREDLDEAHAAYDDPGFVSYPWLTIAARGRRPR